MSLLTDDAGEITDTPLPDPPPVPDSYYVFSAERVTKALPWHWRLIINHLWRRFRWAPLCLDGAGYYNPHAQAIKCGRCNPHAKVEALALALQDGWGYHQLPTETVLPTPAIQYGIQECPKSAHPEDFITIKPAAPFYWER